MLVTSSRDITATPSHPQSFASHHHVRLFETPMPRSRKTCAATYLILIWPSYTLYTQRQVAQTRIASKKGAAAMFDVVVRGGTVIDGTGGAGFTADVGIS